MLFATGFHLMKLDTVKIKTAFLALLLACGLAEKLRAASELNKNQIENSSKNWQHSVKHVSKTVEKAMIVF